MSFFTHNDIEGWHNGLNKRASGRVQMPLYMLVHLLHKEAYLVAYQIRLVSKRKLTKLQKKITTQSKRKLQLNPSENIKLLGAVCLPPKVSSSTTTVQCVHFPIGNPAPLECLILASISCSKIRLGTNI